MSRRRSKLHSERRHRDRNYRRQTRNLCIEIIFIIFLVFVAIKFIKKDDEKPKVSELSIEEQKEIINNEMQENSNTNTNTGTSSTTKNEKTIELKIPELSVQGVEIVKASLSYIESTNLTILNIDVKNYGYEITEMNIPINLVDEQGEIVSESYINVQNLNTNQQTRLNVVLNNDLTRTDRIEIRQENIY